MEARYALAFVARREGAVAMEASRWRHVMSLELGWMAPGEAARYVAACQQAGLLVPGEGLLRLSFDPKAVEVPRGFRADPATVPASQADGTPGEPARPDEGAPGADTRPDAPAVDGFSQWLPRVAKARDEDGGATMAAVEAVQDGTGGLLHAEAALLLLGARAGLDVKKAAAAALTRLRA